VLFDKLTNSKSEDIKFLTFKIYTDFLTQYIQDDALYHLSPKNNEKQPFIGSSSFEQIDLIISN
jgi:hypothetical protein